EKYNPDENTNNSSSAISIIRYSWIGYPDFYIEIHSNGHPDHPFIYGSD
ncbi:853_t:CDS:2, partial [Rhizophagus irregularis]